MFVTLIYPCTLDGHWLVDLSLDPVLSVINLSKLFTKCILLIVGSHTIINHMNMYKLEPFMVSLMFEPADDSNIPHYVAARISIEAAAERKSPAVLEIYPLESLT